MNKFVESLLEFARSGCKVLRMETVSVRNLIEEVFHGMTDRIGDVNIEIGEMPSIRCDPVEISRVFQNLFANAIKGQAKHITVTAKHDDHWLFEVADDGVGISEAQMSNLFIVYRGKKNDSTGAGFGLAICKRVVESHGGSIRADSLKQGTRFSFSIPG